MNTILKLFTDHPNSVGESYLQHGLVAFSYSIKLFFASIVCFVHALLPFLFKTTARSISRGVVDNVDRRVKNVDPTSGLRYNIDYRSAGHNKGSLDWKWKVIIITPTKMKKGRPYCMKRLFWSWNEILATNTFGTGLLKD